MSSGRLLRAHSGDAASRDREHLTRVIYALRLKVSAEIAFLLLLSIACANFVNGFSRLKILNLHSSSVSCAECSF